MLMSSRKNFAEEKLVRYCSLRVTWHFKRCFESFTDNFKDFMEGGSDEPPNLLNLKKPQHL